MTMKTTEKPTCTDWRIYEQMVPADQANWRPGDEPRIVNYVALIDAEGGKRIIPLPKGVTVETHIEP